MDWVQTGINGILVGSLYGLFGLGVAFTFGVMRIVNVAHGEFIVMAAYAGFLINRLIPIDPVLLVLLVALLGAAFGYLLQTFLINRALSTDPLPPLLITFGLSIILRNLMVEFFGADLRSIDIGPVKSASFDLFGMTLGILPFVLFFVTVALFMLLHLALEHTKFGRIVRATSDDPTIVQLYGVNYRHVYALAMAIAVALSSIAGVLLAMRTSFSPFAGGDRLLISFEVVIVGGLGSIWGALLGGFILGVAHLVGLKLDPDGGLLYAHLTFFLILMVMPSGLSARRR